MFNPDNYTHTELVKLASIGEQALIKIAEDNSEKPESGVLKQVKDAVDSAVKATKAGASAAWKNPYGKASIIAGGSTAGLYALLKALSSKKKDKKDDESKKIACASSAKKGIKKSPAKIKMSSKKTAATNKQNIGVGAAAGATTMAVKKLLDAAFKKDADNSLKSWLLNIGGGAAAGGAIGGAVNPAKDIISNWIKKNESLPQTAEKAKNTILKVEDSEKFLRHPGTLLTVLTGKSVPKPTKDLNWLERTFLYNKPQFAGYKFISEYDKNPSKYKQDMLYRAYKSIQNYFNK